MLLIADVGNTHTVLGLWNGREVIEKWRLATSHIFTEDELMVHVNHFLEFSKKSFDAVEDLCVASVVPSANDVFLYFANKYLHKEPTFVNAKGANWIKWNVRTPHEMGADRIANVIAAEKEFQKDVIVVDFGTAITLDILTDEYEGGSILIGPRTSLKALFSNAAKLPSVSERVPASAIGKDTPSNIQSGTILGTSFAIDGLIQSYEEELSRKFKVVATGGEGKMFAEISRRIEMYDSLLTLKGISFYYEKLRPES
jgi:type III pantothenate kinase